MQKSGFLITRLMSLFQAEYLTEEQIAGNTFECGKQATACIVYNQQGIHFLPNREEQHLLIATVAFTLFDPSQFGAKPKRVITFFFSFRESKENAFFLDISHFIRFHTIVSDQSTFYLYCSLS